MTDINPTAATARENAREAGGQFGTQTHTAPENILAISPAVAAWADEFQAADEKVDALIPLVERRFRDLIREQHPDAASVAIGLSYDTDGDALVYVEQIDGQDIEDDDSTDDAIAALRTYGFHHERLSKMSCEYNDTLGGHFTFDLTTIDGEGPTNEEFDTAAAAAWDPWFESAKKVPAIADEVGRRLGLDELEFHFTDTDDDRRVTLHNEAGDDIEEADLLGAMNAYVTARLDMNFFPGVTQDEDDEWTFRYRVGS